MNRIKIYTIQIKMQLEKQLVEFALPENAKQIIGIAVSADVTPQAEKKKYNLAVGNISLSIPEKGDVFYTEMVKGAYVSGSWEDWFGYLSALESKQWYNGIGFQPHRVRLVNTTFITAYYEDLLNKQGIEPLTYTVRVYLHYRT